MLYSDKKSRVVIYCYLALNAFVAVFSSYLLVMKGLSESQHTEYLKLGLSTTIVIASIFIIIHLNKSSLLALKLCFWFCLLQLITIEYNGLTFGFSYGLTVGGVFMLEHITLSINFLALLALGVIIRMLKMHGEYN